MNENANHAPISATEAVRVLVGGASWETTFPNGGRRIRSSPTARSFGLVWPDGSELRTRGLRFGRTPEGCVLAIAPDGLVVTYRLLEEVK